MQEDYAEPTPRVYFNVRMQFRETIAQPRFFRKQRIVLENEFHGHTKLCGHASTESFRLSLH